MGHHQQRKECPAKKSRNNCLFSYGQNVRRFTSTSQSKSSKAVLLVIADTSWLPVLSTVPTRTRVRCRMWLFNSFCFFLNSMDRIYNTTDKQHCWWEWFQSTCVHAYMYTYKYTWQFSYCMLSPGQVNTRLRTANTVTSMASLRTIYMLEYQYKWNRILHICIMTHQTQREQEHAGTNAVCVIQKLWL